MHIRLRCYPSAQNRTIVEPTPFLKREDMSETVRSLPRTRKRLSRGQKKAETRAALLDTAAMIFGRRGFYGAAVEEIAEEAGCSKGAVYSNFESKEDLFMTLLEERHD